MSLDLVEIKDKYKKVLSQIKSLVLSEKAAPARLIAVSKKQTVEKIEFIYNLGHRDFGENYYQEMAEKDQTLKKLGCKDLRWVFLGRLQSNKIKKIVEIADEIQSVDSLRHAQMINRYVSEQKKKPYKVYLLLNAGQEASKQGFSWDGLNEAREKIEKEMPNLDLQGIMAIPPRFDLESEAVELLEKLYKKISEEAKKTGRGKLSLGMSSDLELALKYGSDCVRVGTGIFGKRKT